MYVDSCSGEAHSASVGDGNRTHYAPPSDGGAAPLVRGPHGLHWHVIHVRYLRHALRYYHHHHH